VIAISGTVNIDGVGDDAVWEKTPAYDLGLDLKTVDSGRSLFEPGTVKFAWDRDYLYAYFEQKDLDIIARGDDAEIHHYLTGDVVELFVAAPAGGPYWEFHLAPNGRTRAFVWPNKAYMGMRDPFPAAVNLKAAAQVDGTVNQWRDTDRGWTGEMAVPLAQLTDADGRVIDPRSLRVLVGRYNYGRHLESKELTMYPIMPITWFHMPDRYAFLELVEK
jgi:hypothetical protein